MPKALQFKVSIWEKIDSIEYPIQNLFMTIQFKWVRIQFKINCSIQINSVIREVILELEQIIEIK